MTLAEDRGQRAGNRCVVAAVPRNLFNGHGETTPDNETRHARFPLPNPPPEGEGANESLREFHVKCAALRHTKPLSSDRTASHLTDKTTSHSTSLSKNASQVVGYILYFLSSATHAAEAARPAYTPPPPAVSSGNVVQIIFSLLLVLAAIVLVGWLLKRMNVAQQNTGNLLKVLGAVPIGQRERIVLVEVNDTCLVVGIGPGQIRTLHTFQKTEFQMTENGRPEAENSVTSPQPSENKFANLLSSVLNHRRQKSIDK